MTDGEAFVERVESENQTELSRLGSSKALYAATEGDIDVEPVLRATADAEYAAWRTFESWAESEGDERAREVFVATADEEEGHYETVVNELGDDHDPEERAPPALHDYLRGLEGTPERLGGLVGRTLASDRSKSQVVGFFVGDADPQTASLFREFGDDLDEQLERVLAALEDVCANEDDRERAEDAASGAIEAAYEEYVEVLEGMGANPKPVC